MTEEHLESGEDFMIAKIGFKLKGMRIRAAFLLLLCGLAGGGAALQAQEIGVLQLGGAGAADAGVASESVKPAADTAVGIAITGDVRDAAGNALVTPVNSPEEYVIRNVLGDRNNDGSVDAGELNEMILEFRGLNP